MSVQVVRWRASKAGRQGPAVEGKAGTLNFGVKLSQMFNLDLSVRTPAPTPNVFAEVPDESPMLPTPISANKEIHPLSLAPIVTTYTGGSAEQSPGPKSGCLLEVIRSPSNVDVEEEFDFYDQVLSSSSSVSPRLLEQSEFDPADPDDNHSPKPQLPATQHPQSSLVTFNLKMVLGKVRLSPLT